MKFDCPRTCRARELCRFMPVIAAIGPTQVMSHTVKVKVEMRDAATLERAVRNLKWEWHGQGRHALYNRQTATGHGFQPPEWKFPIVLDNAGELHFDDYGGNWGRVSDLEKLKAEYAVSMIETSAAANGFLCERTPEGITVHSPQGGSLTFTAATLTSETNGFMGADCHAFRETLGLKPEGEITNKPENSHAAVVTQLPG